MKAYQYRIDSLGDFLFNLSKKINYNKLLFLPKIGNGDMMWYLDAVIQRFPQKLNRKSWVRNVWFKCYKRDLSSDEFNEVKLIFKDRYSSLLKKST